MSKVNLIEAVELLTKVGSDTRERKDIPEDYRPRLDFDANGGVLVSKPHQVGNTPDADALLKEFNLDPANWIVTNVRKSQWQRYDGEMLESCRLTLTPRDASNSILEDDAEALIKELSKFKIKRKPKTEISDLTFVVNIGDTQYGKDAGDGTDGTINRVINAIDDAVARLHELRKSGRNIDTVILPQLGDCIEGSVSQHGKVLGASDRAITQQVRIARRILMLWIKAFAPICDRLIIPAVPGNHDESHRITITDATDSWQLEIVSAVQDACSENPDLAHVEFRYPERGTGTLAIQVGKQVLGFAHGHQFKDAVTWLSKQAVGRTAVGDSDVLVTAHMHHFRANQVGHRLWIQVPAMDGGSPFFKERQGLDSPTGIVSFVMGDGYDTRRDLAVLAGTFRQ